MKTRAVSYPTMLWACDECSVLADVCQAKCKWSGSSENDTLASRSWKPSSRQLPSWPTFKVAIDCLLNSVTVHRRGFLPQCVENCTVANLWHHWSGKPKQYITPD